MSEDAGWLDHRAGGAGLRSWDRVYVFNRGDHPLIVFDRDGNNIHIHPHIGLLFFMAVPPGSAGEAAPRTYHEVAHVNGHPGRLESRDELPAPGEFVRTPRRVCGVAVNRDELWSFFEKRTCQ